MIPLPIPPTYLEIAAIRGEESGTSLATALDKLRLAQSRTGSLLSIGLEPSPEYLPPEFPRNLEGYKAYLLAIIEATAGLASAYKFNLAFFESLGWEGVEMMYAVRMHVPSDVLLIADAKRGDIGSTAKHYASAVFDRLGADAVTLSPLMGRDSAEPFLAYTDRLSFFLVLTSNPGAADFLLPGDFYKTVARKVSEWNTAGNCGFVTGATRPGQLGELREMAPGIPFLVPGLGAQGGDLAASIREGGGKSDGSLLLHVTRGILPAPGQVGDFGGIVREKAIRWNEDIARERSNA